MKTLLYCVARGLVQRKPEEWAMVVADPTGLSAGVVAGRVAVDGWKAGREESRAKQFDQDALAIVSASQTEFRKEAIQAINQVAVDLKAELREEMLNYMMQLPGHIRRTVAVHADPTGKTLPKGFAIQSEEDFVKLLPARFPQFKPGDRPAFLRGWELVEQLGSGGFGEVWKARNIAAPNLISAIKFSLKLTDGERALLNEGNIINRLMANTHPGIVALQDRSAPDDEIAWLRYEYVSSGDLTILIQSWDKLSAKERLALVLARLTELAEIVGHFHAMNPPIVHRDLKPSNILIGGDGKLKIADFGIGAISAQRRLDREFQNAGTKSQVAYDSISGSYTPLYAPPEQRKKGSLPAPTDDVHAIGVIAYQMLTGKLDEGPGPTFDSVLISKGFHERVGHLVKSCVLYDVKTRVKSGQELCNVLKTWQNCDCEWDVAVREEGPISRFIRYGLRAFYGGTTRRSDVISMDSTKLKKIETPAKAIPSHPPGLVPEVIPIPLGSKYHTYPHIEQIEEIVYSIGDIAVKGTYAIKLDYSRISLQPPPCAPEFVEDKWKASWEWRESENERLARPVVNQTGVITKIPRSRFGITKELIKSKILGEVTLTGGREVDWSDSVTAPMPRKSRYTVEPKNKNPYAQSESLNPAKKPADPVVTIAQSGNGQVYSGDIIWIHVAFQNRGDTDLVQVQMVNPFAPKLPVLFGRIAAGTTLHRCVAAILPTKYDSYENRVELSFREGRSFPIPSIPVTYNILPLPRPDFATAIECFARSVSGQKSKASPSPGDYGELSVTITNSTGENLQAVSVSLTLISKTPGITIHNPKCELGNVHNRKSARGVVGFAVDTNCPSGTVTFEVRVLTNDGRTFAVENYMVNICH